MHIMNDEEYNSLKEYHFRVCSVLEGAARTRLIQSVFKDYEDDVAMKFPFREQQQYRELFTELVKNFGH